MLAQGQSSSAKRGGLAVVSSGLNLLKKKKKKEMRGIILGNTEMKFLNIYNVEFFSTMTLLFFLGIRSKKELRTENRFVTSRTSREEPMGTEHLMGMEFVFLFLFYYQKFGARHW